MSKNFKFNIGDEVYNKVNSDKGIIIQRKITEDVGGVICDYWVRWNEGYLWEDEIILSDTIVFI